MLRRHRAQNFFSCADGLTHRVSETAGEIISGFMRSEDTLEAGKGESVLFVTPLPAASRVTRTSTTEGGRRNCALPPIALKRRGGLRDLEVAATPARTAQRSSGVIIGASCRSPAISRGHSPGARHSPTAGSQPAAKTRPASIMMMPNIGGWTSVGTAHA